MSYKKIIHCYDDKKRSILIKEWIKEEKQKREINRKAWLSCIRNYLEGIISLGEFRIMSNEIRKNKKC